MASGEQVEEDLFGFAELTGGIKTPNYTTGITNKTELVTDQMFDFDKQLIRRDNDEVVVPILFEKSGVKKYKVLARHQVEDDEDIKRPESSERESPNSEEQRKENINITKKFENIQKQNTDDKKITKRPKVKGNEKTIRVHSVKHLKQSSNVEKFPGNLSKLLKRKHEDERSIEENRGKVKANIVKDSRAVDYEFHGDSDSNSEFQEVKNKSELKLGIDNIEELDCMNDKIVESDNDKSVDKELVKHPSLKIECHVKLRRDPSIENLYRIKTESETKDRDAISNCDSVETTNNESQKAISSGNIGSMCSKNTNPVENVSVCRQCTSEESKPKVIDMVYNVDVPVRKSGRLKSAKCASRYRGDYGIRVETYNQLINKTVLIPSDCDTIGNSKNVNSAQVIGEIDKKDISGESNSDRKLDTLNTCKSVRRIKHLDGIRCTVDGSDIVGVSNELQKTDSELEQFTGVKERKPHECVQDLVESGKEICSGFEMLETKDFLVSGATETEIKQPTKCLIQSKHKPDEKDQESMGDVCDDMKMNDLEELCDNGGRIAKITATDIVEGQSYMSENTAITEQEHCSTVTDHAHKCDNEDDSYDSRVIGINSPEITNEVPCSELMKENQISVCDISSSSGSTQIELTCNKETQMLTNRTVACQAAEIQNVTAKSCDSQLALEKINESLVLLQRGCKDCDKGYTGYVHSVGKSVNKIQQRIEISKPVFIARHQNTDNDALPESSPTKDPAKVLETLRNKLFQNAGADVTVADRVPKQFESKLISSKQRQTGEDCDETRSFLGIEDQDKDNKHVRDSDSASRTSGKSTPRCSTPRSEANKEILEEVAQSLDVLHKAKRKSANSNKVRPIKRQRFEEKKFLLRSMMKNVSNEKPTITQDDTRVEVDNLNEKIITASKIVERTRSSRSSADSLNGMALDQSNSKKTSTEAKEVNSVKKNIGPQNEEKPIKPKPVKCSACTHIFKTKELLRKHYPCRIRQTRTWSQNKLRPNRALKRIENSSKKFVCRLPKSGKSEGTKARPQLLTYRKTKFRRVKGKRRRRLYQLLQDLKQKRMPVKWPHLSIVYNDLSFKEQCLYKIGLICVGRSSQGLEYYTADEITKFEHHRAKVKLDTEDAQTFIHSTPDTIQDLNENLTDISVSTEFSTESDCFSPSVILFPQEIVLTKTNCDTSSAEQESITCDKPGLAVVDRGNVELSDSIHSSTARITSKNIIMPHSDAHYRVLKEIEPDFTSEEVVELNEVPEEMNADLSMQSYTEISEERKKNNDSCLIGKCLDVTVTRTHTSLGCQNIAQLESLSDIRQGTKYLEEVKELVETDLISITSELVEHSHARVFAKESAVHIMDIEDDTEEHVNEPSTSHLTDITVDQQVKNVRLVHNDEISKYKPLLNKHSEYDDLSNVGISSTNINGQHVELSAVYADNKHQHVNQSAKLTCEFGQSIRSAIFNDPISLHSDKDLFGSDIKKITSDIVNKQNEVDQCRPDSVRKYSAESDRGHHETSTVDEKLLDSDSISPKKLIDSEIDVSTKLHSKMVRRSRLQEEKARANEISLFAKTKPETTLNPGLVLQARDMLQDILGDVEQTVAGSENIGLTATVENGSEVNSHSNIGEDVKCKMIKSDKTEHLHYSTYKGILNNSALKTDLSKTLAAEISENSDPYAKSDHTDSVDIKKAIGKSGISPGKKKIDFQTYVKRKGMKKEKDEHEKEYMRSEQHHEIAHGLLDRLLDAVNVIDSIIEEQRDQAESSDDDTFSAITPEMAFEAALSSNNVDISQRVDADKPYDIECVFPYFEVDQDIKTEIQVVAGIMEVDQHTPTTNMTVAGQIDVEKEINRENIPVTRRNEGVARVINTGKLPIDGGIEFKQDICTEQLPVIGRIAIDQDTSTAKLLILGEIKDKQDINTDNLSVSDINPDVCEHNTEANTNGDIETTEHVRLHTAEEHLRSNSDYCQESLLNVQSHLIDEKRPQFNTTNIENNDYSYIEPLQKCFDNANVTTELSEDEIKPDHVEVENEEDAPIECIIEQKTEQKAIVKTGEHTMSVINSDHVKDDNEKETHVECIIDQRLEDQHSIHIEESNVEKPNNSSICDDTDTEELCEYKLDDVMKSPEQIPTKRVRKSNDGQSMKESSRDFTIKYEINGIVIKENLLTGDKNVVENSSPFRSSVESDSICDRSELDTSAFENDSILDSSIDMGSSDVPEGDNEVSNIVNSGLSSNENIPVEYKPQETTEIIEPIHPTELSCTLESDLNTTNIEYESQKIGNKEKVEVSLEKKSFLEKGPETIAMDTVCITTEEDVAEIRKLSMEQVLNSTPYKLVEKLPENENILEDTSLERVPSLDIEDKSIFNKDLHLLRNVSDDLSASPPVLERVEVSDNNMDELDEDVYSMEAVVATEGGPPILELEHFEQNENGNDATDSLMLKMDTSAQKVKPERHFLDVLDIISSDPEETTTTPSIENEMDGAPLGGNKTSTKYILLDEPNCEESTVTDSIGRHFSDVVSDTIEVPKMPKSELQFLFDKSERGEVTLAQIKEILTPISKKEDQISIPKESLLKINAGIANLLSNVSHPVNKDPSWLKRDALSSYSRNKRIKDHLSAKLGESESSGDEFYREKEEHIRMSNDSSDSEEETIIHAETIYNKNPSKGSIADNILQMLTSLEDKGNIADNMCNLLDILAENLGFLGKCKTGVIVEEESSSDSDYSYSGETNVIYNRNSTAIIQKDLIADYLDEGDQPPSLDDIPTIDNSEESWQKDKSSENMEKETNWKEIIININKEENTNETEETNDIGKLSDNDSLLDNEETINEHDQLDECNKRQEEPYDDCRSTISSSYSSDSKLKNMGLSLETSEFDDAEADMESEAEVGINVYKDCDKSTVDVEEQSREEQHKANTIFKSITELNSIETDEESDCGESFDQMSMTARMSELKAIAKDNTTWEFNSDYSSDHENSNQLEAELEGETNVKLESISEVQHNLESNLDTLNHPWKAITKYSNIQYQKDEKDHKGHSSTTIESIGLCIKSNIESNITEKTDAKSAFVMTEGDMQDIEKSESEIAAESVPGMSVLYTQGAEMNSTCMNEHTLESDAITPKEMSTIIKNTWETSVLNVEITKQSELDADISDDEKSQNIVAISTEEQLFSRDIQLDLAESTSASNIEENVDIGRITAECKISDAVSQNAGAEKQEIENNASREEHIPTVSKPDGKESQNILPRESIMVDKTQDSTEEDQGVCIESKYIDDIDENELQNVTNELPVNKFVEEDDGEVNDSCNKSAKKCIEDTVNDQKVCLEELKDHNADQDLSPEVNNEYYNIDHNISRVVEGYTKYERCLSDHVEVKVNGTDNNDFEHNWEKYTENSNKTVNIVLSPELVEEDTNDTLTYDEPELESNNFADKFDSSSKPDPSQDFSNINETDVLDASDNVNGTWLPEEQDHEEDLIMNMTNKIDKRVNETGTCSDHNESIISSPIIESDSVEKCTMFSRNSDSSGSENTEDAMLKQMSSSFNIDEADYSELFCESIAEKVKRKQRERNSSVCYNFNPWLYYSAAYVREATKPGKKEISVFRSSILEKRAREKSLTPDNVEDIGCSPRKKRNSSVPKEATATCTCNDETTEVGKNGTVIPQIQFDLRPCSVDLQKLSEETIYRYTSKKRKLVDESSVENRPPIKVTIKYSQIVYPPNSPYGSASASSDTWRSGCGSCSEESETENDFEQSNDDYCLDSLQEKQITVMANTTELDQVSEVVPPSMLDNHTEGSFSNRGPLKIKMRTLLTKMNSFEKDTSFVKSVQEVVPLVDLCENFNETSNEAIIEAGTGETIESEVLHDINRESERAKSRERDMLFYASDSDSEIGPTSSSGGNKQCTKVIVDSMADNASENKETFESPNHTECGESDVDLSDSDTDTDIQDEIDRILNVSSENLTTALSEQFIENTNSTRTIAGKHSVMKMVVRDLELSDSESESEINLTVNCEERLSHPEGNEKELIVNTNNVQVIAKYRSATRVRETHNRNDTTKSYQRTSDKLENISNNNVNLCSTSACLAQPRNERFQEIIYANPVQAKENVTIVDHLQPRHEEESQNISIENASFEKCAISPQTELDLSAPVNEMESWDISSRETGRSDEGTVGTSVETTLEKLSDEMPSFLESQQMGIHHLLKGKADEDSEYSPSCISATVGTAVKPQNTYEDNIVSPLCEYRDISIDNNKTTRDSNKLVVVDNAVKSPMRAGKSTNVYYDHDHSDEKQKSIKGEIDAPYMSCDKSREMHNDLDSLDKIPENVPISLCDSKLLETDSAVKHLEGDVFHDTQPDEDAVQNNMVCYAVELSDDFETNEAVVNLETIELIEGPLITENNDIHEENVLDTSIIQSHVNDQFELPYEHVSEQIVETLDYGKLSGVLETKLNNAVESITQMENAVYYPVISAVKSKYLYGINEDSQSSNEVVEELVTDDTVSHMTSENNEVLQHAHDPLILAGPNAFTSLTTSACNLTKDTFTDFLRMKNQQSEREAIDLSNRKFDCSIDIYNEACGSNSPFMECTTYGVNSTDTEPVTNYFNITTSENRDTSEMCSDNLSRGNYLTYNHSYSRELSRVHNTDVFKDNATDGSHHRCENSEMDSMDNAMVLEQEVDTDYIITENKHFDNEEETMDIL